MKLSVSLPDDDVALIDEFARVSGAGSRSAVLQQAIRLRDTKLQGDYAAAWDEGQTSGDEAVRSSTVGDGLVHAEG